MNILDENVLEDQRRLLLNRRVRLRPMVARRDGRG